MSQPSNPWRFLSSGLPVILLAAVIAYLVYGLYTKQTAPSPWIGKPVPAFELSGLDGPDLKESHLKGKACLMTFFASWCPSCRMEHRALSTFAKNNDLPLYGVAVTDQETPLRDWLDKQGNPFVSIGLDTLGAVASEFQTVGVPETFLIDNLSQKFIGRLSTVFFKSWHVNIINIENHSFTTKWTNLCSSLFSKFILIKENIK